MDFQSYESKNSCDSNSTSSTHSSSSSSMGWPGLVEVNSSGNRGGAGRDMVAVVEVISDGKAEGAVVDLSGWGVVQSFITPPAPGGYVYPPSYPSHLPRP